MCDFHLITTKSSTKLVKESGSIGPERQFLCLEYVIFGETPIKVLGVTSLLSYSTWDADATQQLADCHQF